MFGLGLPELIVIMLILLLLFGASRLPGIAQGFGGAIKAFRKSVKEEDEPEQKQLDAGKTTKEDVVPSDTEKTA